MTTTGPEGAPPAGGVTRGDLDAAVATLRNDLVRIEAMASRAENIANSTQAAVDPIRRQIAELTADHRNVEGKLAVLPGFTSAMGAQLTAIVAGCLASVATVVAAIKRPQK